MATAKLCAVHDCGKPAAARGLCKTCYARMRNQGRLDQYPRSNKPAKGLVCEIDGCCSTVRGQGLCAKHLHRLQRHGDAEKVERVANGEYHRWLIAHLDHDGEGCLIWPFAAIDGSGYGPSRQMCEMVNGPPPTQQHQAAHSCGNGHLGCVHPKHLRWATFAENRADMIDHGRSLRGQRNPNAVLDDEDVRAIRSTVGDLSNAEAARLHGVSRATISDIRTRRSWAWLD